MKEYVVAIDLGTSCTAYSSKTAADPNPSVGVPDMELGEDIIGKSPTTLLIGGSTGADKVFQPSGAEAFGRVAQRRYVENDIPHGAQIFKRFKMQLHHNPSQQNYDDLTGAVTKSASKKAEMLLLDVFVMALEFIKNAALKRITVTQAVNVEDVTWVLTVPVCCSEPAKYFMRQAAVQAGFIKGGEDDEALVLCMEPIAACLALGDRLSWKINDKYLVIDCGGGTVDISAFVVVSDDPARLDQVGRAVGGPWGSTNVDKQFEGYLKDFILSVAHDAGKKSLESFFDSSAMYRILQAWERAKVRLPSVDADLRVDLSELSSEPLEVEMASMDNGRKQRNKAAEELGGYGTWDLVLRPGLLRKFFRPHCDNIARAVSEQLDMPHLQDLTSVVMVGGFSGSVHVQEAIKSCLAKKCPDSTINVAVAASPDLAIVQGAAHFVHLEQQTPLQYPQAPRYKSIISPTSYGIMAAQAGQTEPMFDPFFLKGEPYALNHVVQKTYKVRINQSFVLSISSCASDGVRPGPNKVQDVGGTGRIRKREFEVASPTPIVDVGGGGGGCCGWGRKRSPATDPPPEKVNIAVEFTLKGIELHVRVKSSNQQVLAQQTVPFVG
eukprot:g6830.t1